MGGQGGVSLGGGPLVGGGELHRVHGRLGGTDTTSRLEAPHQSVQFRVDQPVPGGHGGCVIEQRGIAQHDWGTALGVADDHSELALRGTTQQGLHRRAVTVDQRCGHPTQSAVTAENINGVGIHRGGGYDAAVVEVG
jgi:hypothetical protein